MTRINTFGKIVFQQVLFGSLAMLIVGPVNAYAAKAQNVAIHPACPDQTVLQKKTGNDEYTESCLYLDANNQTMVRHGPTYFYPAGTTWPHTMGYYEHGDKVGTWQYFNMGETTLWASGEWLADRPVGTWYLWDSSNKLVFKGPYVDFARLRKAMHGLQENLFIPLKKPR